tara:strand:+ start:669 stop:1397 length:729 start_codon:yes stop_codon:yes gene_type:complete
VSDIFLSIVIPAYNEKLRISETLAKTVRYLSRQNYSWEIIVANDGSTDGTDDIVSASLSSNPNIKLLNLKHGGKGWAVKNGILNARGKYRFLVDADLSMPIEEISKFMPYFEKGFDIVIGSREVPGANRLDEPKNRLIQSRIFNFIVQCLAVRGISDTQCGFKCFNQKAASTLFPLQMSNGFSFDVEILFLARKHGFAIEEIPIEWHYRDGSKVRPIVDSIIMLKDILAMRLRHVGRSNKTP